MSNNQADLYFQAIRQWLAALQTEEYQGWQQMGAAVESLYAIYQKMETDLQAAESLNERLVQQNQQLAANYYHYQELFQTLPIAYLVISNQGVILEATQAIGQLLQVPSADLIGKPLLSYIASSDRPTFRTHLTQLSHTVGGRIDQINFCTPQGRPFPIGLTIDTVQSNSGSIKGFRIRIDDISYNQRQGAQPFSHQIPDGIRLEGATFMSQLPRSLDGLRVLVVDDEADIRELVTAVLKSHGISVKAVSNAAAALQELDLFRPDVLVSDIRMPGDDGYSLIRQIRALEAERGGHIPAAAITAYLEEDRTKALTAGYEAYLHKLARPTEWVELVVQLANHGSAP